MAHSTHNSDNARAISKKTRSVRQVRRSSTYFSTVRRIWVGDQLHTCTFISRGEESKERAMANIPRALFLHIIRVSVIVWIVILLISLIYLGSGRVSIPSDAIDVERNPFDRLQDPYSRTNHLDVYVIDMDLDAAGMYFLDAFYRTPPGNLTLHWIFKQAADLSTNAVEELGRGEVWAAVYINAEVTTQINRIIDIIVQGSSYNATDYDPSSAVTIVYDEVRSVTGVRSFVLPAIGRAIAVGSAN